MTDSVKKGKLHLIIVSTLIILLDISSTAYSLFKLNSLTSINQYINNQILFRTFIYGVLIFFCFKGYLCAKWILCILSLSSAILLLINFNISNSLFLLILGVILMCLSVFLFISKSIKLFMSYQTYNT